MKTEDTGVRKVQPPVVVETPECTLRVAINPVSAFSTNSAVERPWHRRVLNGL